MLGRRPTSWSITIETLPAIDLDYLFLFDPVRNGINIDNFGIINIILYGPLPLIYLSYKVYS